MPIKSQNVPKLFSGIDTTAFAAIMVVLVFAELISGAMSYNPHHGVSVDVPRILYPIAMPGAMQDDVMQVSITPDGKAFFGSDQIVPDYLTEKIQTRLADLDVERKVYIRADARARFGTVKVVVDGVRSAGILRVAFLVDQRRVPSFPR
ncbi:MAG: biopolymer transporter ExbD [Candidatus Sulfotelmatobacter sp.]